MTLPDLAVRCRRTFAVPMARVFRAWTDPAVITRWWSPEDDIAVDVLNWDLTPGGAWRFGYRFPSGQIIHVTGRFLTIDPPRALALTWTWEPPDVHAGIETRVVVTMSERDGATTVEVVHEQFPNAESRDRHDAGWTGTLDRLQEVFA